MKVGCLEQDKWEWMKNKTNKPNGTNEHFLPPFSPTFRIYTAAMVLLRTAFLT